MVLLILEQPIAKCLWSGLNPGTGQEFDFDHGVFIGADASYQSASFDDIQNTIPIDSRFLVNARACYEMEN